MQTVGALYAIFIAIFVLTIQYMEKHEMLDYKIETTFINLLRFKAPPLIRHFMYLSATVAFTILSNGYIIYVLTITESEVEGIRCWLILSLLTLVIAVLYIVGFSYSLIKTLVNAEQVNDVQADGTQSTLEEFT